MHRIIFTRYCIQRCGDQGKIKIIPTCIWDNLFETFVPTMDRVWGRTLLVWWLYLIHIHLASYFIEWIITSFLLASRKCGHDLIHTLTAFLPVCIIQLYHCGVAWVAQSEKCGIRMAHIHAWSVVFAKFLFVGLRYVVIFHNCVTAVIWCIFLHI